MPFLQASRPSSPAAIAKTQRQPRQPGSAIDTLTIIVEDQAHLEGFEDYTP